MERIQSCCGVPATAELCSAWTGEAPVPTRAVPTLAFLAGQRLDGLHRFRLELDVAAGQILLHVLGVGCAG